MPAAIKIPTQFTAVDKFSNVIGKMASGTRNFATTGVAAVNRFDHKVNSTFKKLGRVSQLALGLGFGALFINSIDDIKASETAIASFRTIVSDLSDEDFAKYKTGIGDVAKDTKKSITDVAMSFEKIAGLNASFAKTEKGISLVSKASIVLSKASGDDLGASAENLVGIMNQFSLKATEADRTINVLAAGQAVGAASITQTAESFKNYGSVASGANITLEESVGLIQTLGKFSLFGAEAGTKLRGVTLKLQKAGIGYASGQFSINDALEQAKGITSKLSTEREKDAFMLKTFGAENISVGKILLNNIDIYKEFTKGVKGTSEAHIAAGINSNTLGVRLQELKNAWTNNIIASTDTGNSLNRVKSILIFVADNMETVVSVGAGLIGSFVLMKGLVWGVQGAMFLYNVALGFTAGLSGTASIAIGKNAVALGAYKVAQVAATAWTWLATAATTAFGVAMNLGLWPILLIVAAIAGLIALFYNWDSVTAWFGKQWGRFTSFIGEAWSNVVSWFKEFDFIAFFKNIGQSILKYMLLPLKTLLSMASSVPGEIGKIASFGLSKINDLTGENDIPSTKTKLLEGPEVNRAQSDAATRETMIKGRFDINLNDPGKMVESVSSTNNAIPVLITPTQGNS